MPERILLIGMMGAGKSTVGQLLASRLGWRHLDSDEEIQRITGQSVPEMFASNGEASFRAMESKVLAGALSSDTPAVVSVAGGAVMNPLNRQRIRRGGVVVWLRARVETLTARVGDGSGRPLLGDDPNASLRRLDAQRRPVYRELSQVVVDVDAITPRGVVERILSGLAGSGLAGSGLTGTGVAGTRGAGQPVSGTGTGIDAGMRR